MARSSMRQAPRHKHDRVLHTEPPEQRVQYCRDLSQASFGESGVSCIVTSANPTVQRISVILNHRALWMHESLFMEELRAKR